MIKRQLTPASRHSLSCLVAPLASFIPASVREFSVQLIDPGCKLTHSLSSQAANLVYPPVSALTEADRHLSR